MAVHLGAAQGEVLVHHSAEGELVHYPAVHAEDEDAAALAAGVHRLPDGDGPVGLQPELLLDLVVKVVKPGTVGFHADRLDADVRPAAPGALAQLGGDAVVFVVDGVRRLASRSGSRSITITRSAPLSIAARAAICPTAPAPQTATTSSGWTPI